MEFSEWLASEMEARGYGVCEMARRAKNPPGTISRILSGMRTPGPAVCRAIAEALEMPVEEVFQRAGIITRPSLVYVLFSQLTDEQREVILQRMRAMAEENQRRTSVCQANA